jgi:3-phosphoshikimate 1-carboxyvinyltransferase
VIDCGNSGTTMRLISGILAAQPFFSVLTGDQYLRRRPMRRIVEPLDADGRTIYGRDQQQPCAPGDWRWSLKPIDYYLLPSPAPR